MTTMTATSLGNSNSISAPVPPAPMTLADTGLSADQVTQLLMKALYMGESTGLALSDRLKLPYGILEPLIEQMRAVQLIEVRGAAGTGTAGYRYALTDAGRVRGRQY